MEKLIYKLSTRLVEWSNKKMWEKRCTCHELGVLGYCKKCGVCPLYGKVAYVKGGCMYYVEIPNDVQFDPLKLGAFIPRYKRKEALDSM